MRIIKIISIGAIGFALGLGLWQITKSGYFEQWEKLSAPPQKISELIPAGAEPLFIKTSDSSIYSYSTWHNEGWVQEAAIKDYGNPFEVTKPCNFTSPEFSPLSNSPQDINDCFQEKTMEADGYIQYAFILDSHGNVWEWDHIVNPSYLAVLVCFSSSGLFAGIVLAFLITSKNQWRQN